MNTKNILIILIAFAITKINAQEYTDLEVYKSPVSKIEYKIGDSVELGRFINGNSSYFSNVYNITNAGLRRFKYSGKNDSPSEFTNFEINGFRQYNNHIFYKNEVFFELVKKGFPTLYVSIDKAIKNKEVLVFKNKSLSDSTIWFDKEIQELFKLNYLELTKEEAMRCYIEDLNKEKFKEWENNEFTYHKDKDEYIELVDSLKTNFDTSKTVLLCVESTLDKYNFENQSFQIVEGIASQGYFSRKMNSRFDKISPSILGGETIYFNNFEDFQTIYSEPDNAEFFVNNAEVVYIPYPNRAMKKGYLLIEAKVNSVKLKETQYNKSIHYHLTIKKIICLDNKKTRFNFIGINNRK